MDKRALRKRMIALRRALDPEEAAAQAGAVYDHIMSWPVFQASRCVLLYASMPEELSTRALLQAVLAQGKRLLLPRCEAPGQMTARWVDDLRGLTPGVWGIGEPASRSPVVRPGDIDLALCPGLAFDAQGGRLGFGAGYYDTFLRQSHAIRAGLCFEEQVLAPLHREAHDIPMEYIITARGIHRCNQ